MASTRRVFGPISARNRTDPDRTVGGRSRGVLGGTALLAALVTFGSAFESAAHACSPALPGILNRTVWPHSERIPTNPRLVVRYQASGLEALAGLGEDLVLLDGDTPVPSTVEGFGQMFVLRPSAPLLPDHAYQLADRRTLPCETRPSAGITCALSAAPQPFATFLTGSGADTTAPTFGGMTAISVGERSTCNSSACCGPYEVVYVDFTWTAATDDFADGAVGYRVYRRENSILQAVADVVDRTELSYVSVCSGTWIAPSVAPGRYVVRAFDAAGNEDSNMVERRLGDACATGCAVGGAASTNSWTEVAPLLLLLGVGHLLAAGMRRRAQAAAGRRCERSRHAACLGPFA